ncbi:MAG TPA: diguanylate cyclase [Chthonomonadaceae bacterium]|nr:diguanylate cyclase [Chthonomonadaceae bacterium]
MVSDLVGTGAPLLALYWAMQGSFRRGQRIWGADLIALYLAFYAAGMGCWTFLELALRQEAPFPSLADACYIPSQLCLMAGLVVLPFRRAPLALRGRALLDGMMFMAATVAFSWYFVLGPNLLAMAATALAKAVSIYYPLSDLAMLVCLLVLMQRAPSPALKPVYAALTGGVFGIIVADSLYGYMALKGTYASGSLIDVGWPFSQLLIAWGVAALRAARQEAEAQESAALEERSPLLWRSLAPYALVPALGLLLIYVLRTDADPKLAQGVYFSSAALLGLILLRQVFAILENNRLYGFLKDAYRALEASQQELEVRNRQLETKTQEAHAYAENLEQAYEELMAMQAELIANNRMLERVNADLEEQKAELAEANAKLAALATTDGMTGLPNHRAFQERLREELAHSRTTGSPLSLLLMDVDEFKQYNDAYGHPAGDEALRIVARLLRATIRATDMPARYGGEEFAVLLPDTDALQMLQLAEQIRAAVEAHPFPHRAITLSIGAAEASPGKADAEALIALTDQALYHAKHSGRNCVRRAGVSVAPLQRAA